MSGIAEQLEENVLWRYQSWKSANLPAYLSKELNALKSAEITERFYQDLHLGDNGMAGKIGVGTNCMNIYTVRRISRALAEDIRSRGFGAQQRGVVIAYDTKRFSKGLAEQAAIMLASYDVKTYLFEQAAPTCEMAFAIRYLHSAGGMVMTGGNHASGFGGCKIYDEHGVPIGPETVKQLSKRMKPWENVLLAQETNAAEAVRSGKLVMIGTEIDEAYLTHILETSLMGGAGEIMGSSVRIVYTAAQGSGGAIMKNAFVRTGFTAIYAVPEGQERSACESAVRHDADLIIEFNAEVNELGLSIKQSKGGYLRLSPDETAALLLEYICIRRSGRDRNPLSGFVMRPALSNELTAAVGNQYGLITIESTNGFRQIATLAGEHERNGSESFLFGYEETGGYGTGGLIRDKDALQTAVLIAEMAAYYKSIGKTLYHQLTALYAEYGWYANDRAAFTFVGLTGQQQVRLLMARLRTDFYRTVGRLKVEWLFDYYNKEQLHVARGRRYPMNMPASNTLKYKLEDGSWFGVRAMLAEPGIELYFGSRDPNRQTCRRKLAAIRSDVLYMLETMM